MGLYVSVYRAADTTVDCTLNGISKRFATLCVVNAEGPFKPAINIPPVLVISHMPGAVRIVPAEYWDNKWQPRREQHMFGGNYASCSDSRFRAAVVAALRRWAGHERDDFYGAVAIHDRVEA